jgi:hypothetical protein
MRAVRFTCHNEGVSGADPTGLDFAHINTNGCRAPPPPFLLPPSPTARGRTRSQSVGDDLERAAVPRLDIEDVNEKAKEEEKEEKAKDAGPRGGAGRRGSWCPAGVAVNESKSPRTKEKEYAERRIRREKNVRRTYETKDLEIFNLLRVPVWIFDFKKRQMLWCNLEGLEVPTGAPLLPRQEQHSQPLICVICTAVVSRHSGGAARSGLGRRHVAGDTGARGRPSSLTRCLAMAIAPLLTSCAADAMRPLRLHPEPRRQHRSFPPVHCSFIQSCSHRLSLSSHPSQKELFTFYPLPTRQPRTTLMTLTGIQLKDRSQEGGT